MDASMVALEDDRVVKKLQGGMFTQLQNEIKYLTTIIQQKDQRIAALEANQLINKSSTMIIITDFRWGISVRSFSFLSGLSWC